MTVGCASFLAHFFEIKNVRGLAVTELKIGVDNVGSH